MVVVTLTTTTTNNKRVFIQFETTPEEKQEIKQFVRDKGITVSRFFRSCYKFFKNLDMTPEEFVVEQEVEKPITAKGEQSKKVLERIEQRDERMENSLSGIRTEMRNMKASITNDFIEYLSTLVETPGNNKGGE